MYLTERPDMRGPWGWMPPRRGRQATTPPQQRASGEGDIAGIQATEAPDGVSWGLERVQAWGSQRVRQHLSGEAGFNTRLLSFLLALHDKL